MLGVVLVYLAYAAAAGAAVGAIGYVAAGRFSLVQRLLATLMSRTLDRIADSEQATYSVTHTDTGALAVLAARGRRQTSAEAELGLPCGAWCHWGTCGPVVGLCQIKNAVPGPRTSIAATTAVAAQPCDSVIPPPSCPSAASACCQTRFPSLPPNLQASSPPALRWGSMCCSTRSLAAREPAPPQSSGWSCACPRSHGPSRCKHTVCALRCTKCSCPR
jgi:hypothetical protein